MAELKLGTTIGGNVAWHEGNDGSGSGLDADYLDGNHASAFLLLTGGTITGLPIVSLNNSTSATTTGSHLRLENPSGSQTLIGFTFAGTAKSAIRADSSGNLILNAVGDYYYNYELGTTAFNLRNGSAGIFQSISGTTVNFPGTLQQGTNQVLHAGNYSSYAATSGHNHTYDVNNAWLRDANDDANVKLYGNSRQMAFRTDGTTEYASGVGGYPFAWMYGGDAASQRLMLLNTSGDLWTSTNGWLSTALAGKQNTGSYLTGNQTITLSGDASGSGATSISVSNNYLSVGDNRTISPSTHTAGKMRFGFTSWNNNGDTGGTYADYLHFRSYTDSSGGADNLLTFRKTGGMGMRLWQQSFGSGTAYSTYRDVALISISDTAPTGYTTNLWWQSSTGKLKIYYYDGTSSQWVDALPIPDTSTFYSKAGGAITGPVVMNSSLTVGGNTFSKKTNITANGAGWDDHLNLYSSDATNRWNLLVDSGASNRFRLAYNGSEKFYVTTGGDGAVTGNFTANNNTSYAYNCIAGEGYGVRFWSSTSYAIAMGSSSLYQYGTVTDYSIKTCMDNGSPGRGFTWGRESYAPVASINATSGNFQTAGTIYAGGNITAYSDLRLKDDIRIIDNALEKVHAIRGVTYNRTDIEKDRRHTGVIAQEVEAVLPEVVIEDNAGIKTVAYGNMVGLLIEAIKEQQKQIEELKAEVQALKVL